MDSLSDEILKELGRVTANFGRLHFYLVLAVSSLMSARPGESQIVTWERSSKQILNAMVSLYRAKYPLTARGIVGIQN